MLKNFKLHKSQRMSPFNSRGFWESGEGECPSPLDPPKMTRSRGLTVINLLFLSGLGETPWMRLLVFWILDTQLSTSSSSLSTENIKCCLKWKIKSGFNIYLGKIENYGSCKVRYWLAEFSTVHIPNFEHYEPGLRGGTSYSHFSPILSSLQCMQPAGSNPQTIVL